MSLNDRQHVEAVAIMRALIEDPLGPASEGTAQRAARQWLAENHPGPAAYMAALRDRGGDK